MNKETRIVIPIDNEFKGALYNSSDPETAIVASYSTALPRNTFTFRSNETNLNDNTTVVGSEGNFSFIANVTAFKPFVISYQSLQHYNEGVNSIEASLALSNELNGGNFINQLFTQSILQSTQFSFYYSEAVNGSNLFLGDFSTGTNISNIFNSLSYCQTKTSNWECQVKSLTLKSHQYNVYSNIIIDTSSSVITLPLSDYKLLLAYYLGEANCIMDSDNSNQIKCKCASVSAYDPIKLTLENKEGFYLNPKSLIDLYPKDAYKCHWKLYVNRENLSNWVIGRPGLVNSFYSFDLKTKRFGFLQDVTHINNLATDAIIVNEGKESGNASKLGWVLTLAIVLLLMGAVYQFAANGNAFGAFKSRKNSLDINDNEDRKHMLSISQMFQKEDEEKETKAKGDLVEMKEMLIEKK